METSSREGHERWPLSTTGQIQIRRVVVASYFNGCWDEFLLCGTGAVSHDIWERFSVRRFPCSGWNIKSPGLCSVPHLFRLCCLRDAVRMQLNEWLLMFFLENQKVEFRTFFSEIKLIRNERRLLFVTTLCEIRSFVAVLYNFIVWTCQWKETFI